MMAVAELVWLVQYRRDRCEQGVVGVFRDGLLDPRFRCARLPGTGHCKLATSVHLKRDTLKRFMSPFRIALCPRCSLSLSLSFISVSRLKRHWSPSAGGARNSRVCAASLTVHWRLFRIPNRVNEQPRKNKAGKKKRMRFGVKINLQQVRVPLVSCLAHVSKYTGTD